VSSSTRSAAARSRPERKQREGKSVEADAAGFEGDDFVVFTEDAESDERGDESAERCELINQIGNQESGNNPRRRGRGCGWRAMSSRSSKKVESFERAG